MAAERSGINWKDVTIGSITTLLVTIIAGLTIYYFTKENPKAEDLRYDVQHVGDYQSPATRVAIQTIRIENRGNIPANQVRITIDYPSASRIIDKTATMSSGPVGSVAVSVSGSYSNRLDLVLPSLTPGEYLTVSVVLDQGSKSLPDIFVKSDASLGKRSDSVGDKPSEHSQKETQTVLLMVMMSVFILFIIPPILQRFRRRNTFDGYAGSLNNAAFAMMHKGDAKGGLRLLTLALLRGEGGEMEFANRALSLALSGKLEEAKHSLDAAQLLAGNRKRAVIEFNRCLIALTENDLPLAEESLRTALSLQPKQVREWANYSTVFQSLSEKAPKLRDFLGDDKITVV